MNKMVNNIRPKIIIVDDHDIFRDGIRSILTLDNIADVVAEASNGRDFLNLLEVHVPDLVLMDIDMPVMNGIEASKKALEKFPWLNILVLTMFSEEKYYYEMVEAGVKGFILKSCNKSELEKAIQDVCAGNLFFKRITSSDHHKNRSI